MQEGTAGHGRGGRREARQEADKVLWKIKGNFILKPHLLQGGALFCSRSPPERCRRGMYFKRKVG